MNQLDVAKEEDDDLKYIILTDFAHLEEVNQLIDTLSDIIGVQNKEEIWEDRLQYIFNQYQPQPHLLDPYLEILLHKCIKLIDKSKKIGRRENFVFRLIYLMVKTRGYKAIIRLMPHEVSDLEPVLSMLADITVNDNENWQARYVLLLWLSIVIMIPFDMNLFDSANKEPISLRILKTGKYFLLSKDVSQIAAAFMLSKFLFRPDTVNNKLLEETIHWAIDEIKNIKIDHIDGHNFMCGLLRLFTYLFKFGKREDLLPFSTLILETNNQINCVKWEREILLCRLRTKLVQRIGLVFLKVKLITWRYQRGNRILLQNMNSDVNPACESDIKVFNGGDVSVFGDLPSEAEFDADIEVSEYLDEVIDFLINSLRNYFTFVRWSAAKGIGRICSRLPKKMADDVVEAILVLFSRLEGFNSWHGGCLALAELGRRGYLLPQRLPEVLPLIIKALYYDEKSGECSYGANVRDAACYVCWSFARAYNPEELKPYVVEIASTLIMVTLFDRQVNVRRAASAAFQENVGRQGQFPHGIEILTTCDYFAVRNSTNCFLNLSVFIASFKEYVKPMIDHLIELKVGHWDYNIRELTAKALHKLLPFAPDYILNQVLPGLIKSCVGVDLYKRQGSIMAVGELITAMDNPNDIPESMQSEIKSICTVLDQRMQFRGLTGELMRKAMCHLILCCSTATLRFHDDPIIDQWYKFLKECASHKEKFVRTATIDAFPDFLNCYGRDRYSTIKLEFRDLYLAECTTQITTTAIEYIQATYLAILGKTPRYLLDVAMRCDGSTQSPITEVLQLLLQAAKIDSQRTAKWGEARSYALTSIVDICDCVSINNEYISKPLLLQIYSVLLLSLDDYTLDSHGDIGALVRESAMRSLYRLTNLVASSESRDILDSDLCKDIISKIAQQAVEKIDRVRNTAGKLFYDLISLAPNPVLLFPDLDMVREIFCPAQCDSLYWASPQVTFPLFCRLLRFDSYRYRVVLGLAVSVGGMTEKTVEASREALHQCLKEHENDTRYLAQLAQSIVQVMIDFSHQDRIIYPLFKMIDFLHLDPIYTDFVSGQNDTLVTIIDRTKSEIAVSKDILKIKSGIEVFCSMLQFDDLVWRKSINALMVLIGHKFPVIRKHTASKLYETLLSNNIVEEDKLEMIMNILQDTVWDNELSEVRQVRNTMCELFGIPIPKSISVKKA